MAAALGIFLGLCVHVTAVTLGLAGLVAASPLAFEALRWAGAAYLAWIAWKSLTAPPMLLTAEGQATPVATAAVVRRGFVTCLLNPKLLLFFLSFLPQFIRPEAGSVAAQTLILALILVVPGLALNAAVGLGGGGIGRWMARHPRLLSFQSKLVGLIFLALALRLALAPRG
ncbi:LysE family translocator [Aerophototrophica crusticola]|uniref:LysE family translocator n=1 Tax=Aerophototrophica crusticola TaxID=1709002 RepID=A0A858R4H0_9PROT|nr:LysE family translocator [Rhodospirillaceae bacterium B3]